MLKQFNFKNFLSFDENGGKSNELSMITGRVRKHQEQTISIPGNVSLLKAALIYGANGSGKSNLIKALDFMRTCVLRNVPDTAGDLYNRTRDRNKRKNSYFEVEIILEDTCYAYGFEINLFSRTITSEWLLKRSVSEDTLLFERNTQEGTYTIKGDLANKNVREKISGYLDDFKQNQETLFLTFINKNLRTVLKEYPGLDPLRKVYFWFAKEVKIIWPYTGVTDYLRLTDDDSTERLQDCLQSFGTGVSRIDHKKMTLDQVLARMHNEEAGILRRHIDRIRGDLQKDSVKTVNGFFRTEDDMYLIKLSKDEEEYKRLLFIHPGLEGEIEFSLADESDGTIRLLDLLDILLTGSNEVFVIDELDRCLHPNLVYKFVEDFLKNSESQAQLICTTHESSLLDFDLVRRDEIWFTEKDDTGNSKLYSMEEYNERFDKVIEKAYREGRYGGVPVFSTIFPCDSER